LFIIGPEGDFTDEEIQIAKNHDIQDFSLGTIRLRAETAGIHVLSINHYLKNAH
jgi:16S rRNA (uracil1498-N3)-methyltransferase